MKKYFYTLITTVLLTSPAMASNALGVIIGDPSGISGRMEWDSRHSIDGALAYSTGYHNGLHIHGTYLWDRARSWSTAQGPIDMYYGLGLRMISITKGSDDGKLSFGPRAPVGLIYNFNDPDIELFGELALALDLTPKTDIDLDVGFGARIRF